MDNWFHGTVESQYANSPRILALIESFNDAIDPGALIDSFYENIWNIDTAVGYGLDVWGRIVGVNRVLQVPPDVSGDPFIGFNQASADPDVQTWGHGAWSGGPVPTQNYSLPDDDYRTLILVKALSNITDRSAAAINASLMQLFPGRGNAWVQDNLNMTATYRFDFALSSVELAILTQSGVVPRPAGVLIDFWNGDLLMEDGSSYILTESGDEVAMET